MTVPDQHELEVGAEVVAKFHTHKPVAVAFWAKEQDRALWSLFIASNEVTSESNTEDYTTLIRLTRDDLDLFAIAMRVMLIPGGSRMARDAMALARRGKGRSAGVIVIDDSPLGDVAIDGALLYPNFEPATAAAAQ